MNIRANIKVGDTVFQLEPKEGKIKDMMYELVEFANELEKTPTVCEVCQGTDVVWRVTKTKEKGYKYIKRFCINCKASATMGERQEDGMLYWRRNEQGGLFEKYTPQGSSQPAPVKQSKNGQQSVDSSDIPF